MSEGDRMQMTSTRLGSGYLRRLSPLAYYVHDISLDSTLHVAQGSRAYPGMTLHVRDRLSGERRPCSSLRFCSSVRLRATHCQCVGRGFKSHQDRHLGYSCREELGGDSRLDVSQDYSPLDSSTARAGRAVRRFEVCKVGTCQEGNECLA